MSKNIVFRKLTTCQEMLPQFELVKLLTTNLTKEQYEIFLDAMVPHNYYQVIAEINNDIVAVSGYWIATKIYSGKYLEIDNFIVKEEYRNAGVGKLLVQWMEEEAKRNECQLLMLDAYVENFKAHAFYYREGFIARGFHYIKEIKK